jgi:hypothetical protein
MRKYLAAIGREGGLKGGAKGGSSKSAKKVAAVRRNFLKAAKASGEVRRKYPPCPHYSKITDKRTGKPYRGHRFSKKTGKCACGLEQK